MKKGQQTAKGFLYWALVFLAVGSWHAWDGWNTSEKVIQKKTNGEIVSLHDYEVYVSELPEGVKNRYPKVKNYLLYNRIVAVICAVAFLIAGYIYWVVK